MRILFLSNYYPPYSLGGYEQWCQEVANELASCGHQVIVITSAPAGQPVERGQVDQDGQATVERVLRLEVEGGLADTVRRMLGERQRIEAENITHVREIAEEFEPDVAFIWGMWNVPRRVPALVEELLSGRIAYYFCDYWTSLPNAYIQRWQETARSSLTQLPKWLLGQIFLPSLQREPEIPLALEHPICVSHAVRDLLVEKGVDVAHAAIIHGGTQVEQFVVNSRQNRLRENGPLRLLYIGRLAADKGVHTAIRAVDQAVNDRNVAVKLDLVGRGHPDYEKIIRQQVADSGLDEVVTFVGLVDREEIPAIMAQYDVLLFPSEWDEPFARSVLEGMAAGLALIGTTIGGTGEILIHGETGLTFPAGDSDALTEQIALLADDRDYMRRLAEQGRQHVINNHTFAKMVGQIEETLRSLAEKDMNQMMQATAE